MVKVSSKDIKKYASTYTKAQRKKVQKGGESVYNNAKTGLNRVLNGGNQRPTGGNR